MYADRPWIKNYDPGIPPSLSPYPQKFLHDFMTESAQANPESVALITSARLPGVGRLKKTLTYGQLDADSDALAAALVGMGLKPGGRVALILPNVAAFAIAYYAVLKAGGVAAACNPTYPAGRMQYQIDDCDAEIVITLSLFYNMVKQIQPQTKARHVIVTNAKDHLPPAASVLFTLAKERKDGHYVGKLPPGDAHLLDLLRQYAGKRPPKPDITPDDIALFQYTGGTTGVSKGAMLSHQSLVVNTLQIQTMWRKIDHPSIQTQDASQILFLGVIPMFHAAGMVAILCQAMSVGAPILLVPNPRDLNEVVDVIHTFQPSAFVGVPALFNALNNHPRVTSGEVSLSCLKVISSGTAPLSPATKQTFERISGSVITEGYGMSESVITHSNPFVNENRINSVGFPLPDVEVKIVSLEDDVTEVPVGEAGQLLMAGPTIMRGYHNMPDETAIALREIDGKTWLYTGDIAYMDTDGYFYIVDRKKDMAIIGGYNVYPNIVEKALAKHPAVRDVGVAAIPHPEKVGQEALKAWVVLHDGQQPTPDDLMQHCSAYLLPYEVPRRYAFVAEIPRSAIGKTLRRELIAAELEGK